MHREIVRPERLVYTQVFDVEPWSSQEALITRTFVEQDGETTLVSTSLFPSVEDRDAMLRMGMEEAAAGTLDRLADYL